jgi:hypothetical protein
VRGTHPRRDVPPIRRSRRLGQRGTPPSQASLPLRYRCRDVSKDLALELECEAFKWRWDAVHAGHKTSASLLAQHLIKPLISMNATLFAAGDAPDSMEGGDLEKVRNLDPDSNLNAFPVSLRTYKYCVDGLDRR